MLNIRKTSETLRRDLATAPALLLIGWSLVSLAIASGEGLYEPHLIAVASCGVVLVVVAAGVWAFRPGRHQHLARSALAAPLFAGLLMGLAAPPGLYRWYPALVALSWVTAFVLGVLGVVTAVSPRYARRALVLLWVGFGLGAFSIIRGAPEASNDVFILSTQAVQGLLRGENFYSLCWTNHSDERTECVFPYLPGSALLEVPAQVLLGDVRYGLAGALIATSFFVSRIAAPAVAPALAALVLIQPRELFLLEHAWTEPLVAMTLTGFVWAATRRRTRWAIVFFAAALFTKQHVVLIVPLTIWWRSFGLRRTLVSLAIAGSATLPWVVTAPREFLDDALWFNLELPPRLDSLSLFTAAVRAGWEPHFAVVAAVTFLTIAAVIKWFPRNDVGYALGVVTVLGVFTLLNKQSFFNHWSLWLTLILVACAVLSSARHADPALTAGSEHPAAVDEEAHHGPQDENNRKSSNVGPD